MSTPFDAWERRRAAMLARQHHREAVERQRLAGRCVAVDVRCDVSQAVCSDLQSRCEGAR